MLKEKFQKDFIWGAASCALQIEGSIQEDGKTFSVWDVFSMREGVIKNRDKDNVACDHYHRYKEDVQLMKQIGLQGYRFSTSWPRVLPNGTGTINKKGLDFYDKLVDELLANNIEPFLTLFHWDTPFCLHEKGGWQNPDSANWFAEYAKIMGEKLGDRVKNWMTFNEMAMHVRLGYYDGVHAPGEKLSTYECLRIIKNLLLAHGKGTSALRSVLKSDAQIGLAHCGSINFPADESSANIAATRKSMFELPDPFGYPSIYSNSLYLDPVFLGKYDQNTLDYFGEDLPKISDEEMKSISQPIDFLGLNYYLGFKVEADENGNPVEAENKEDEGYTCFDWPLRPDGLHWGSKLLYERYNIPILITENGLASSDWVGLDGKVHDQGRIDFLNRYLNSLSKAGKDGVPLLGYMQWAVMDVVEWEQGFGKRFGLIYVDHKTQKRTLKDSALWYKKVITSNGENLL